MPNYLHKVEYYDHTHKALMESHITNKCERKRKFKQDKENMRYNLPLLECLTSIGVAMF